MYISIYLYIYYINILIVEKKCSSYGQQCIYNRWTFLS